MKHRFIYSFLFLYFAVCASMLFAQKGDVIGENLEKSIQEPSGSKKSASKIDPSRLRFLAKQIGLALSGKGAKSAKIFISIDDLNHIGIPTEKTTKIQDQLGKARAKFHTEIQNYRKRTKYTNHSLKIFELDDIEYIRFGNETRVLALSNVAFYYAAFNADFTKSGVVIVEMPLILLLNDRWRVSEIESIKESAIE